MVSWDAARVVRGRRKVHAADAEVELLALYSDGQATPSRCLRSRPDADDIPAGDTWAQDDGASSGFV
eukprot:1024656-Pyramimonas_sp.AAC.1